MKLSTLVRKLEKFVLYRNKPVQYARKIGVKVGDECKFMGIPGFGTEPYLITIGDHVLISYNCDFITHDGSVYTLKGLTGNNNLWKYGRINVGNNVSIGANVTILPGVTIGDNSIVGARSLVTKNIPSGEVWGGVPAKRLMSVEEYLAKIERNLVCFDMDNYRRNKKDELLKRL